VKISGQENALMICNHRSDIDWLIGWVLAQVGAYYIQNSFIYILIYMI